MKANERVKAAIIEVVENQINSNDPPETKKTLERLIRDGYSERDAKELIGTVVAAEVFGVMDEGRPFDHEKYVGALNKLPETPE